MYASIAIELSQVCHSLSVIAISPAPTPTRYHVFIRPIQPRAAIVSDLGRHRRFRRRVMRGSLIALVLLAGFVRADDPELPSKAQNILRTYCYRCHGQEGVFEGGLNYLLDPARLIAAKKIVPGKPDESKLYQRVIKGT